MNSHTEALIPESQRSPIAVGLLGIGLIHTLDLPSKWHETAYLAAAYVVVIVASLVAAGGLVSSCRRRWRHIATAAAAGPLVGYVVSRTVGLPGSTRDIGNWLEPLGLASLFVEATVLLFLAQYSLKWSKPQSLGAART